MDIKLNRNVFDKSKFYKTVDASFKELKEVKDPNFFDVNLANVEDFFTLYNKLFFEIPKYGDNNSHEYLVKESTEHIDFTPNQDEINALLEEIDNLRNENLELRKETASLIEEFTNTIINNE